MGREHSFHRFLGNFPPAYYLEESLWRTLVCGIVGIIARNSCVAPDILERATLSLAHRGPDDSGTVILRTESREPIEVGLGSRRLAILDLSSLGHQPMKDQTSGNWIVFNGEIYNFHELRKKLEDEGVAFDGHSDTEVLLKAYGRWGERCLAELRGMFAFAVWDARQQRLFLARDPMGIKPLYFFQSEQYFLFASELRTLLGTGLLPRKLDGAGLLSYLTFGSVYDPTTMVQGVMALLPGHYLVWQQGKSRSVRYWDLVGSKGSTPRAAGEDKSKVRNELRDLLDHSVRLQLVSDVPVGVFLSGGIDSSSLVALVSQFCRPNTFSLVFREADYDEAVYSRAVAKKFSTQHQELSVSQGDVLDGIPAALQAMDQPTMDGINTFLISRQTRAAGIKVALSGLGGDEVFGGYASFQLVPKMETLAQLLRFLPGFIRRTLAVGVSGLAPDTEHNRKIASLVRNTSRLVHPYYLSRMLFRAEAREALLRDTVQGDLLRSEAPLRDNLQQASGLDAVNRVSYLESRSYMLNTLLRDTDAMSMAHGLEIRVPLIDHILAQRVLAYPGDWKVQRNTPKPLLVDALQGLLPPEIVNRPKRGFTLPFEHWLKDEIRNEVETAILRIGIGPLASVLDPEAAKRVWGDFLEGKTSWSRPWALFVLQRWCELNSVTL
jgi:asparagine synthase (glutamine-hydrolysing)